LSDITVRAAECILYVCVSCNIPCAQPDQGCSSRSIRNTAPVKRAVCGAEKKIAQTKTIIYNHRGAARRIREDEAQYDFHATPTMRRPAIGNNNNATAAGWIPCRVSNSILYGLHE
jgi:hypothetical protein